jgi:hypothetical protein
LQGQGTKGFDAGIALAHRPGTTQTQLLAVRNSLGPTATGSNLGDDHSHHPVYHVRGRRGRIHALHSPWTRDQLGFDTALALHIGRRLGPKPPRHYNHRQRVAHALVRGLQYAPETVQGPVLHTVDDPESHSAMRATVESQSVNEPFWWTLGAGIVGFVVKGPVGAAVGAGLSYFLTTGGMFEHSKSS